MNEKLGIFLRIFKFIFFVLLIIFIPSLRSCGKISYGFPVVSAVGPSVSTPFNIEQIIPINAMINFSVMGLLSFLFYVLIHRRFELNTNYKMGIAFIRGYIILVFLAYLFIYPFFGFLYSLNSQLSPLLNTISLIILYVLYPPIYENLNLTFLSDFSTNSSLYGASDDIKIRLYYVTFIVLYFFFGFTIGLIINKIKKIKIEKYSG